MGFSFLKRNPDEEEEYNTDAGGDQINLFIPSSFGEAQPIADQLKMGHAVIVNLSKMRTDEAQRTIDFLTGIMYALSGKIQAIGNRVILCNPRNMDVNGSITMEE